MTALAHVGSPATRRPRAARIAAVAALVLATGWLLMLGLLHVAGYRPLVVHSASMAPAVDTGDLVITRAVAPSAVAVGDVVSFHDRSRDGRLITHRVTSARRQGRHVAFVTRGDVNSGVERWSSTRDARVGRLALRVPLAGYAVTWLTRLPIILALLALVLGLVVQRIIPARTRRPARGGVVRAGVAGLAGVAAIVSAPIMLGATEGAFSAVAANAGNTFAAAASFCPASQELLATEDTYVTEASPTLNRGGVFELDVVSQSGGNNARVLVNFAFPAAAASCTVTSAQLSFLNMDPTAGRTLRASRALASWGEFTAHWNNQPAVSGANVAAAAAGFFPTFDVTQQVKAMYLATPPTFNGFRISDSAEGNATAASQALAPRELGNSGPKLTLTFG
jgi:signal peptidase I